MPTPRWKSIVQASGNTIILDIPLLSDFRSTSSNVLARVEIGRQDQWRSLGHGEGRELSVSSALLRGVVVHKGLRSVFSSSFFHSVLIQMLQGYHNSVPPPYSRDIVWDLPLHILCYSCYMSPSCNRMAFPSRKG